MFVKLLQHCPNARHPRYIRLEAERRYCVDAVEVA